jgi:hypothetical protein
MRYAVGKRLIQGNPFDVVPRRNIAPRRRAYIDDADAGKVVAELPITKWQLLYARQYSL